LTYPIIKYAEQKEQLPPDPLLKEKYLRLRKILMHFRAHGKEKLAKYKHKIEHERVLRNDMGRAVLRRLLADGILTASGKFYYLQPDGIDKYLGISWLDLRRGRICSTLVQYLRSIA
jgi:hypothetical protein